MLVEYYENIDVGNLYGDVIQVVLVIYDEQKNPWIAFYIRTIFHKDDNRLAVTNYWLFNQSNNGWSFVKDFSQSKDVGNEFNDLLKNRYDLVLK